MGCYVPGQVAPFRLQPKRAADIRDVGINYDQWLGDIGLSSAEVVDVAEGLSVVHRSIGADVHYVRISGGTAGQRYLFTSRGLSGSGEQLDVRIEQQVIGDTQP